MVILYRKFIMILLIVLFVPAARGAYAASVNMVPSGTGAKVVIEPLDPYSVRVFSSTCDNVSSWGAAVTAASAGRCSSILVDGSILVSTENSSREITPIAPGMYTLPAAMIARLENRDTPLAIIWSYGQTTITTNSSQSAEQRLAVVKKYLERLAGDKKLDIQLNAKSDFDKSGGRLLENIKKNLPKYYRLKDSVPVAQLVPSQPRMFYSYGDYTGNVELPAIEYLDTPPYVYLKTNMINDVLPACQQSDSAIKLVYKDSNVKVTNTSEQQVTLDKIALYYNGSFFDKVLDPPLHLAPKTTSGDISFATVIKQELKLDQKHSQVSAEQAQQRTTNFGFGLTYKNNPDEPYKVLSQVISCTISDQTANAADTAALAAHMAALARPDEKTNKGIDKKEPRAVAQLYDFKIEFDFGKAAVRREYLASLNKVGQAMKVNPRIKGMIEGYTDNVGTPEANQRLSELRASAAKEHLVSTHGIDPGRIQVKGYGAARAASDNSTPEGRALNRRIEGHFWETAD